MNVIVFLIRVSESNIYYHFSCLFNEKNLIRKYLVILGRGIEFSIVVIQGVLQMDGHITTVDSTHSVKDRVHMSSMLKIEGAAD